LNNFFEKNKAPEAERTIKQSIETVLSNAKWLENNREDVAMWLNKNT